MLELKGKKLLILGGADVHSKIVKAARELGVYTIVTDYLDPVNSPAKLLADEHWEIDINNIDEIVKKCIQSNVDGVLAFCLDPAQIPYQRICEKLEVPCYGTRQQFEILTNKVLFKEYCISHGVDVIPEYSLEEVKKRAVSYPLLVKPSESRGSRGQSVCNNFEEVVRGIAIAEAESKDGKAIIEKYMQDAQDMSFSYVVINGEPFLLKIGDRILGHKEDNLDRQQIATILPSLNKDHYINSVEKNVKGMIKSLGIRFGAVFLQGFWEDGKVYFYDPGMRFPGGDFDIVLKEATGYDNMKTFVKFALTGDTSSCCGNPENAFELNHSICLILSVASREGKIDCIEGYDLIKSDRNVFSASLRYHDGDMIPKSGDIRQRVAEFTVHLSNRDNVYDFIRYVYSNFHIWDENKNDMIVSRVELSK